MADHTYNPIIANKYGMKEAAFINHIIFWTRTNATNNKNFREGRYWCYGTPEYFQGYFYYFSLKQMRNTIEQSVKKGLLEVGRFNRLKFDRTQWYALSDKVLSDLNLDITCLETSLFKGQ